MKTIFIAAIILSVALCHSNIGPLRASYDGDCTDQSKPAPIQSWHIHVLYWQNNKEHFDGALKVRDNFISYFKDILGENILCSDDEEKDNRLCMFKANDGPIGPWLTAQWCAFVPLQHFNAVVQWGLQHRQVYDTLFHPNSGCGLQDHTWWALWAGQAWQLDLSIFQHSSSVSKVEKEEIIAEHQQKAESESALIKLFNQFHKN